MKRSIILVGIGGHGSVVLNMLLMSEEIVAGVCDPALKSDSDIGGGLPHLNSEELIQSHPPSDFLIANGIGFMPGQISRQSLFQNMQEQGYDFLSLKDPSSIITRDVKLGIGTQIMAGAIIQTGCDIGENTIVNTGAQIDHGCIIGSFSHICPGAILSGDITVDSGTFIGAGAVIINGLKIGRGAVVGAGAIVIEDVPDNARIITPTHRTL